MIKDIWAEYKKKDEEESKQREEVWAKYKKKLEEDSKQREEAWAKTKSQLDKQDELQTRFERILNKWEEQAERQDLILESQEKALKIKQPEKKQGQVYDLDY